MTWLEARNSEQWLCIYRVAVKGLAPLFPTSSLVICPPAKLTLHGQGGWGPLQGCREPLLDQGAGNVIYLTGTLTRPGHGGKNWGVGRGAGRQRVQSHSQSQCRAISWPTVANGHSTHLCLCLCHSQSHHHHQHHRYNKAPTPERNSARSAVPTVPQTLPPAV